MNRHLKTFVFFFTLSLIIISFSNNAISQTNDTTKTEDDFYNLDLESMMNIEVVTVSKKAENLFDSPLSSSVITKEEIFQSGATSIPELLRLIPGLIVREKTNDNFDLHIRGNDNIPPYNKMHLAENSISLIMIDNRVVYNHFQGGTLWETLPIDVSDIEKIEVIRGPATALYGPNAVSGVIHFITKRADSKKLKINSDLQVGTQNTQIGNISASFGISDKIKFRFSSNYKNAERFSNDYYTFMYQGYTTRDSLGILTNSHGEPLSDSLNSQYPDDKLAIEKFGANGYIFFDMTDKINFDFSFGIQESKAQTIFIDNGRIPITNRESQTSYTNLNINSYGFNTKISAQNGTQDVLLGIPGFHYDMDLFDMVIEYDGKFKDLIVRPGISYQKAIYDCTNYIDTAKNEGFFNGEKELSSKAVFLRAEYLFSEKLKLVAAIRADKYKTPDDVYLSYQFISSYKIDENNLIRMVYSRANRGPFILDTYTDFYVPIIAPYINMHIVGNENLDLLTMNMFELGIRNKLLQNLHSDFEIFYSTTTNFTVAKTDSVNEWNIPILVNTKNLDITSKQFGISGNINYVINKKLKLRVFGTLQSSFITGFEQNFGDTLEMIVDLENKSTPTLFGGIALNYSPTDRINFNTNIYSIGKQTFTHESGSFEIDAKTILNAKLSYRIWKNNLIYVNVRNFTGNYAREYSFADDIGSQILLGFNMSF